MFKRRNNPKAHIKKNSSTPKHVMSTTVANPKVEQPKEKVVVEKPKPIVEQKEEKKENPKQMLSFRIPTNVIDDIDKYAYVERMNKQDVIIMALEKFFNSKDSKEVLSQYDKIKK